MEPTSRSRERISRRLHKYGDYCRECRETWNISRSSQEEFALDSHMKSIYAGITDTSNLRLSITSDDGVIDEDGCIETRPWNQCQTKSSIQG